MEKHEPIHEVSDNVIGPVCNGESSDCNFGKFGLSQPMAIPWQRLIIFATEKKEKKHTHAQQQQNILNKLNHLDTVI